MIAILNRAPSDTAAQVVVASGRRSCWAGGSGATWAHSQLAQHPIRSSIAVISLTNRTVVVWPSSAYGRHGIAQSHGSARNEANASESHVHVDYNTLSLSYVLRVSWNPSYIARHGKYIFGHRQDTRAGALSLVQARTPITLATWSWPPNLSRLLSRVTFLLLLY